MRDRGNERYAGLLTMAPLKTLLSTAAFALVLLLGTAANASAAGTVPCWKQVISDWYDGRIDNVYPLHCYHEAIAHLPEDVQTYSSAKDEINRALMAALRHDRDGYGGGGTAGASVGTTASGPEGPSGGEAPAGVLTRLLEALGPSNAESVPLPLLVLAVIALLLLAAAAASFVAKRVQARRPPGPPPVPATAPAQPPKQP
jgi:hypothetical protein